MGTQTLQEQCADVILKALGEKPDLIQTLVGERALEHLEKTIRKEERKKAALELKHNISSELSILVPAMVTDIIRFGMGESSVFFMKSTYKDADPDLVEQAWVIAKKAVETCGNEQFHLNFAI